MLSTLFCLWMQRRGRSTSPPRCGACNRTLPCTFSQSIGRWTTQILTAPVAMEPVRVRTVSVSQVSQRRLPCRQSSQHPLTNSTTLGCSIVGITARRSEWVTGFFSMAVLAHLGERKTEEATCCSVQWPQADTICPNAVGVALRFPVGWSQGVRGTCSLEHLPTHSAVSCVCTAAKFNHSTIRPTRRFECAGHVAFVTYGSPTTTTKMQRRSAKRACTRAILRRRSRSWSCRGGRLQQDGALRSMRGL
ncbi:hypothetical protein DFJ73DRAFT_370838 [Zopfochytrium polystomum]|nr:hypothetical protein DFJ73DRAFT_370838 [Zopfochytrium polystomum]